AGRGRGMGLGAGDRAVAAPHSAGPGRSAAAQVPVSVPTSRRRSGRQLSVAGRGGRAVVRRPGAAFALGAALALLAVGAVAQDLVLRATADRTSLRENESFTYTVRAE